MRALVFALGLTLVGAASAFADCRDYDEHDRALCESRKLGWEQRADCDAFGSHVDRGRCKQDVADIAKQRMNDAFTAVIAAAEHSDIVKPNYVRHLRQTQADWSRWVASECLAEAGAYGDGTLKLDVYPSCEKTLTLQRTLQLLDLKRVFTER